MTGLEHATPRRHTIFGVKAGQQPQPQPPPTTTMPRAKARKVQTKEDTMQKAIRDYRGGKFPSIRKAAAHDQVDFTTLSGRLRGTKPAHEAHPKSALLTRVQEEAIVELCLQFDSRGLPLELAYVTGLAFNMQDREKQRQPGRHWISRFLNRHPILACKIASHIDRQRAQADDQKVLAEFFQLVNTPPQKMRHHPINIL